MSIILLFYVSGLDKSNFLFLKYSISDSNKKLII